MKLPLRSYLIVTLVCILTFPVVVFAQRTVKVVARFADFGASASSPIQNKSIKIKIGSWEYFGKTSKKGWLVMGVPCGKRTQLAFGSQYEHMFFMAVPCQKAPVGFGLFEWRNGSFISNDMDFVDGCRNC